MLAYAIIGRAAADPYARMTLLEENDSLYFHTDKHYTQGARIAYLAPSLAANSAWQHSFDAVAALAPVFAPKEAADRRYALFFGQSIFTPENVFKKPPDPRDRPYAGWLYAGVSLLQRDDDGTLENLELAVGVVGPAALGKQVQNDWHQLIGFHQARGWSDQLQNEPAGIVSYDRHWRHLLAGSDDWGIDIVPEAGATAGNVFVYGEVGATARFGSDLGSDYGPVRIRPSLSGTDYFDSAGAQGLGGYFYVGARGQAVLHNIFLDGNTFRTSPSVPRKLWVADLQSGVALMWARRVRVDFSVARRTEEFAGQRTPDVIGTAAISFAL
ncbi:MAG: lipid A deacylase LpxR family protein [Stellaceae bacterium]